MATRSLPERIARAVLQGFFMTDSNGFDDMSHGSRLVSVKRVEPLLNQLIALDFKDKELIALKILAEEARTYITSPIASRSERGLFDAYAKYVDISSHQ